MTSVRGVAFPPEHGAWGFLSESLLLGLLAAPSATGAAVAAAGIALFLLRHPLKILVADRLMRGRGFPRTRTAAGFATLYGATAAAALGLAGWLAPDALWLAPLAAALPAGLVQMRAELRSEGRAFLPEALGAASAGSLAASCALAAGWRPAAAVLLWALLAARAVSAIVITRTRIRLDRSVPTRRAPAWILPATALAGSLCLIAVGALPRLAAVVFAALLARAIWTTGPWRRPIRPQQLGWQEMVLGIGSAVALGLGYRLEL